MVNLNEMNTKELKAMAKELGVKNWWNLKKSELINEIAFAIGDKEDAGEEVDVDAIAETAATIESEDTPEELQIESESTEEAEADTYEPETEEASESESEAPKEVKKPSLKIKELTYDGRTQSIKEWAAELEMPWPTLYDRVNRNGWAVEEALTIPLGERRKKNKEKA